MTARDHLSKFLKVGNSVADLLVQIKGASPLNLAALAFRIAHTVDSGRRYDGWVGLDFSAEFGEVILANLPPPTRSLAGHGSRSENEVQEFDVHGLRIVSLMRAVPHLFVQPPHSPDDAKAVLGRLLWEKLGTSILLHAGGENRKLHLSPLPPQPLLASKTADDLVRRFEPFLAAKKPRAALFVGPPGTGKSTAMRSVASSVGGLVVHIDCSSHLSTSSVAQVLLVLRPNVVIVDDIDRSRYQGEWLSLLETIRGLCKLVMCSVNHVRPLDHALLRPGRFDEIAHIEHLDPETVEHLIGAEVPEDVAAMLRELPIAYIAEFHARREVLGLEEAQKGVLELVERRAEIARLGKTSRPNEDDE